MNTPNNNRYQQTEKKICDTFLSLLETRDISHISVNALCQSAGINRSTFYAHFEDITFLIRHIDQTMRKNLMASFPTSDYRSAYENGDFLIPFLAFIKKHASFYKASLCTRTEFPIPDGFEALYNDIVKPICFHHGIHNQEQILYTLIFMQAGFTFVLKHWVLNGCTEDITTIASYLRESMHLPIN